MFAADRFGAAGPSVDALERAGVPLLMMKAGDVANAAAGILDAITAGTPSPSTPSPALTDAVEGAAHTHPSGHGGFAWARRLAAAPVAPLVAASHALWGSNTSPPRKRDPSPPHCEPRPGDPTTCESPPQEVSAALPTSVGRGARLSDPYGPGPPSDRSRLLEGRRSRDMYRPGMRFPGRPVHEHTGTRRRPRTGTGRPPIRKPPRMRPTPAAAVNGSALLWVTL